MHCIFLSMHFAIQISPFYIVKLSQMWRNNHRAAELPVAGAKVVMV